MRGARDNTVALIRRLRRYKLARPRRRMPRQLQPDGIRLEYFKAIRRYLDRARELVERKILPLLPGIVAEMRAARGDRQDAADDVNASMDRLAEEYWQAFNPRELDAIASQFADRTSSFQRDQLRRQARAAMGVDPFAAEPDLMPLARAFVAENVALIKSIPNTYFHDIEKTVTREVRAGTRHEDIARQLRDRHGVAENRAKLIARDQVGKFYGDLNRVRQKALGVDKYTWRTVNDNRVRPEHVGRDGRAYAWNAPPFDGHPGHAVNCRCYAEPDFSDLLDASSAERDLERMIAAEKAAPKVKKPRQPRKSKPVSVQTPKPTQTPVKSPEVVRAERLFEIGGKLQAGENLTAEDQHVVREHIRGLLSKHGMVDRYANASGNSAFTFEPQPVGILAYHSWDGQMLVNETQRQTMAEAMMYLAGPVHGLEKPALTPSVEKGLRVLAHEEAHGHSPIHSSAYQGAGAKIEEVTTELAARRVVRGISGDFKSEFRPYQGDIDDVVSEVMNAQKLNRDEATAVVEEASVKIKGDSDGWRFTEAKELVYAFVQNMDVSPRVRYALEMRLSRFGLR